MRNSLKAVVNSMSSHFGKLFPEHLPVSRPLSEIKTVREPIQQGDGQRRIHEHAPAGTLAGLTAHVEQQCTIPGQMVPG